jgi:hypothetical protein
MSIEYRNQIEKGVVGAESELLHVMLQGLEQLMQGLAFKCASVSL